MLTDSEVLKNLSLNVQRLLADRQMSQSDLARKTGDPQPTISRMLRCQQMPNIAILSRIAEAFDVSLDRLVAAPQKLEKTSA